MQDAHFGFTLVANANFAETPLFLIVREESRHKTRVIVDRLYQTGQRRGMPIQSHPGQGTIITCDFDVGFKAPEMVKKRPVVVLCPSIAWRPGLCTVVGLSTTAPNPVRPYHCKLILDPPLPHPWAAEMWVKGDMVATVGFHRLDLIRLPGRDEGQRRIYRKNPLTADQLKDVRTRVLHGLGMFQLTRHL